MTEHAEQCAVMDWVHANTARLPGLALIHSSLNGAHLQGDKRQRVRQVNKHKRAGMLPGVADLFLPVARGGFFGMFIEMKRAKGGKLSENQTWFLSQVCSQGYYDCVAHGAEQAIAQLEWYMGLPPTEIVKHVPRKDD